MDALSAALRDLRVTGALLFNAEMRDPWGYATPPSQQFAPLIAPGSEHLVLFHLITEGRATARVGQQEIALRAGDVVVIPHSAAHELWHGQPVNLVDGSLLLPKILSGSFALERGGGGGEKTTFVCGYFGCERYAERLFLAGLPPLFKVNIRGDGAGQWLEQAIRHALKAEEPERAGRAAVLARLAEALFVETLSRYMDALPAEQSGWLAAVRDEVAGSALALLHREPARAWTLDTLAMQAGTSRSVVTERFNRCLGESPLAYLARWRLQLAARLLETTDQKVLRVALAVGYQSEAAFNRAFKAQFSLPPAQYRRRRREGHVAAP